MAIIQCPECGGKVSDAASACPHCGYPLVPTARPDPHRPAPTRSAPAAAPGRRGFTAWVDRCLDKASGEKLEKRYITFRQIFKAGTKKYSYKERTEQMDRIFVCGTEDSTPRLSDIRTDQIHIWVFWYVILFFYIATFGMEAGHYIIQNSLFIPGMIVYGAFGVPLGCMLFFSEINLFRSIPLYRVIGYFLAGACLSLFFALIGFAVVPQAGTGNLLPAMLVGVIEETAKAVVAIAFLIREKRARSILDGLLIGSAVGAGFAAFETMGYILLNGWLATGVDQMDDLITMRGYFAPGGHVAWAALEGAGFMLACGYAGAKTFRQALSAKCLIPYAICVVIHGLWDADLLYQLLPIPYWQYVFCVVAIWVVLMYYINLGFQQIDKQKALQAAAPPPSDTARM